MHTKSVGDVEEEQSVGVSILTGMVKISGSKLKLNMPDIMSFNSGCCCCYSCTGYETLSFSLFLF